ncbi:MAG: class I SAM-dependent methyltransferase [Magnetococcus sp. MYC-9]
MCQSGNLREFADFGLMPLAGDFQPCHAISECKVYPLKMAVCLDCSLVQVLNVVPMEVLFSDYRYLSSITHTLIKHFADYAEYLKSHLLSGENPLVVEFGCNDGVLLSPLKGLGVRCVGVDAAPNVVKIARDRGLEVYEGYFGGSLAQEIVGAHGLADVITASNVFAHTDDLEEIMKGVDLLLGDDGVFIVEVHYVVGLISGFQFDSVYHEHLLYYSLTSISNLFARYGMRSFDVHELRMHGGAIRVFACRNASHKWPQSDSVTTMLLHERDMGVHTFDYYSGFGKKMAVYRSTLHDLLVSKKRAGCTISAYGASGRGTILLNYCGLDSSLIDYVVDESPSRIGRCVPGVDIPIRDRSYFHAHSTDICLITAWNYQDEVIAKEQGYIDRGGEFIIPLPDIKHLRRS